MTARKGAEVNAAVRDGIDGGFGWKANLSEAAAIVRFRLVCYVLERFAQRCVDERREREELWRLVHPEP